MKMVTETGRILALDLGRKRIGLAVSDELRIAARGLETLDRKGRRHDIEMLRRLTVQLGVKQILMGNPLHMNGESSEQSEYTREFASELERKTGLPLFFRDERLTSWEAEGKLRGRNVAPGDRRAAIDQFSALILLQDHLNSAVPALLPEDVAPDSNADQVWQGRRNRQ